MDHDDHSLDMDHDDHSLESAESIEMLTILVLDVHNSFLQLYERNINFPVLFVHVLFKFEN